jgi:hypothetical protein
MKDFADTPKAVAAQKCTTQAQYDNEARNAQWEIKSKSPAWRMQVLHRDLTALRTGMRYCGHISRMHEAFFEAIAAVKRELHETIELL